MSNRSRLIVFDLGNVLVRICAGWQHACQLANINLPKNLLTPDPKTKVQVDQLIHDFDCGRLDLAAFASAVAPHRGLTADQVIAINDAYLLGPFDGAGDLLDDLHAAGHRTACLSNTNASHWATMTDTSNAHGPVLARLRHRFASHLAGVRKPDPAIFEHVEHHAGASPSQIVFFDDVAENVDAAKARGWSAHLVAIGDNPIPAIRQTLRAAAVLP